MKYLIYASYGSNLLKERFKKADKKGWGQGQKRLGSDLEM
jgi:hypothetical protein